MRLVHLYSWFDCRCVLFRTNSVNRRKFAGDLHWKRPAACYDTCACNRWKDCTANRDQDIPHANLHVFLHVCNRAPWVLLLLACKDMCVRHSDQLTYVHVFQCISICFNSIKCVIDLLVYWYEQSQRYRFTCFEQQQFSPPGQLV